MSFYYSDLYLEVFWANEGELSNEECGYLPAGWYYLYCFPGYLPGADPIGPFKNEKEALTDARKYAYEFN